MKDIILITLLGLAALAYGYILYKSFMVDYGDNSIKEIIKDKLVKREYIEKEVEMDLETAVVKVILEDGFSFTKEFEGQFLDYGYNTIRGDKVNLNITKASDLARRFVETPWNAGAGPIVMGDIAYHKRLYTTALMSVKPNVIKKVVQLEVLE